MIIWVSWVHVCTHILMCSNSIFWNFNSFSKSTVSSAPNCMASVGWLVVFYVPSTASSFRDGTPIYCRLWRMWSSVFTPFPSGIEPRAIAWQSITLPLHHASSVWLQNVALMTHTQSLYIQLYLYIFIYLYLLKNAIYLYMYNVFCRIKKRKQTWPMHQNLGLIQGQRGPSKKGWFHNRNFLYSSLG